MNDALGQTNCTRFLCHVNCIEFISPPLCRVLFVFSVLCFFSLILSDIWSTELDNTCSAYNCTLHHCYVHLLYLSVIHIQNQPRMAYEAMYRRERPAQYQPESWARSAARRLILGGSERRDTARVRHSRLVVYLLYLQAFKSIYLL